MGKLRQGEELQVYLAKGKQVYLARRGDVLDGQYRVDDISEQAVVFVYLPLKQVQNLVTGQE